MEHIQNIFVTEPLQIA